MLSVNFEGKGSFDLLIQALDQNFQKANDPRIAGFVETRQSTTSDWERRAFVITKNFFVTPFNNTDYGMAVSTTISRFEATKELTYVSNIVNTISHEQMERGLQRVTLSIDDPQSRLSCSLASRLIPLQDQGAAQT